MKPQKNTAKDTVLSFLTAYFSRRSTTGCVPLLSEKIHWLGTSSSQVAFDRTAVVELLHTFIEENPVSFVYTIEEFSEVIRSDEHSCIALLLQLYPQDGSDRCLEMRMSVSLALEGERFRIVLVHCTCGREIRTKLSPEQFTLHRRQQGMVFDHGCYNEQLKAIQEICDVIPCGIAHFTCDKYTHIVYYNDATWQALGYEDKTSFDKNAVDGPYKIIHKDDYAYVEYKMQSLIRGDVYTAEYEHRVIRGDHSIGWVRGRLVRINIGEGCDILMSAFLDITKEKLKTLQTSLQNNYLDHLFKTLPCGIVQYAIEGDLEPLNINTSFYQMHGFADDEEFFEHVNGNILNILHKDDISYALNIIQQALATEDKVYYEHRTHHKDGHILWLRGCIEPALAIDGSPILQSVFLDVTEQKNKENLLKEQHHFLEQLYNTLPCGVVHCDAVNHAMCLYINRAALSALGYKTEEEFWNAEHHCLVMHMSEDERHIIEAAMYMLTSVGDSIPYEAQIYQPDDTPYWIMGNASLIRGVDGNIMIQHIFFDVTKQKGFHDELKATTSRLQALMESVPGGIAVYRVLKDGSTELEYANDSMLRLAGYEQRSVYQESLQGDVFVHVHPDDKPALLERITGLIIENERLSLDLRLYQPNGECHWVNLRASVMEHSLGKAVLCAVYSDIHKLKESELEAKVQRQKFEIAMSAQSKLYVWEYDIKKKQSIQSISACDDFAVPLVVENFPDSIIEQEDLVDPTSMSEYIRIHQDVLHGKPSTTANIRYRTANGSSEWHKTTYTTIFDESGNPARAIGVSEDLTPLKAAEQRYQQELLYREAIEADLVASCRINLTQSTLEEYRSCLYSIPAPAKMTDRPIVVTSSIPDPKERETVYQMFTLSSLIQTYKKGENTVSIEYRRILWDDAPVWVNTTANLMHSPTSDDLIAFVYTRDINDSRVATDVIQSVVSTNFDFVNYIDGFKDTCVVFSSETNAELPPRKTNHYTRDIRAYINKIVAPYDRERCLKETDLPTIIAELEKNASYIKFYDFLLKDNKMGRKKIHFTFMDKEKRLIIATCTDITDIFREESKKNMMLRNALAAAEQASVAKSEFLSRMSHEIRTPMNAIIGLTTIALEEIVNTTYVKDNLEKIDLSARFLLSLINDILDMSRIESGKMTIQRVQIVFETFIEGINAIIQSQADTKDIAYTVFVRGMTEPVYLGDSLKLQQVLINVLSNAIKFTPKAGAVRFYIEQIAKTQSHAILQFRIQDSGVGISQEFIPQLFDPFAQEHIGTTTQYGGTGLGLAICKNIVDLMDGNISVQSVMGSGAEFKIEVPLELGEPCLASASLQKKLSVLVVDEDPLVCRHHCELLHELGFEAQGVESGKQALSLVESGRSSFDMVFLEWKMSGMNGLETARRLRPLVAETTHLVMISHDWSTIEQEAMQAGICHFLKKPLFGSSLAAKLANFYNQNHVPTVVSRQESHDFTGKRVLLAEDHPLNIEVAKKLLSSRGLAVDVAHNGLVALEKFLASTPGYYDAILMDIRMPVMDGLTAAGEIRSSAHPSAKTIPILAMTANAFEEDIQKSSERGMNAHLAKPIDAKLLYATLGSFLE